MLKREAMTMRTDCTYEAQKRRLTRVADNTVTIARLGGAVAIIAVVLFVMWRWLQ